ncbi:MAG: hypothetical protein RIS54_171 [Verrucomicrobiota bacterium]|jgi:uncharacterized cupin superfamily protein
MVWSSTTGKYHGAGKQVSEALGAKLNANLAEGGHPFDLEFGKLLPGKAGCAFHTHSAQWECFVFLSGRGRVRTPEGFLAVGPGDVVLHPPGTPHQTIADAELACLIVTDNPTEDIFFYPDSNKWGTRLGGKLFRINEVDYFDGEE